MEETPYYIETWAQFLRNFVTPKINIFFTQILKLTWKTVNKYAPRQKCWLYFKLTCSLEYFLCNFKNFQQNNNGFLEFGVKKFIRIGSWSSQTPNHGVHLALPLQSKFNRLRVPTSRYQQSDEWSIIYCIIQYITNKWSNDCS